MIQADHATLLYQEHERNIFACNDIQLKIQQREFLGVLGPSGSGKSSLLYLLSGLKLPTSGKIHFEQKDYSSLTDSERSFLRRNYFGFIFQQPYLLGYLTVLENILIHSNDMDAALYLLDALELKKSIHNFPHQLSGGERQRVCIARAIVHQPKIIFADEPTAFLDHQNGTEVIRLLCKYKAESSLVMVTHDPSMLQNADRIIKMNDGMIEFSG